jgi:integrase
MRRAGLVEMLPDAKGKNRPVQAFGPHTLRHAAVSLWIEQGLSPKRVQELAGHASLTMTMDLYGHLWADSEGDAALARKSEAIIG